MSAVAKTARRLIAKGGDHSAHAAVYRATGDKVVGRMLQQPGVALVTT